MSEQRTSQENANQRGLLTEGQQYVHYSSEDGEGDTKVEIESGGILYRGFVEEAIFHYATNEAVKYKLIVKDIEL